MGRHKIEDFTWTHNHTVKRQRGPVNPDRTNRFVLPSISDNHIHKSGAIYNYKSGVLDIELIQYTPFEWLDTRRMRNEVGRRAAGVFGADRWLYYTEQPVKSKYYNDGRQVYFQQLCLKTDLPSDEKLIEAYNILKDGAIEGEECGDFKVRHYNSGAVPLGRDYNSLTKKRKRQFDEYQRELEKEFGG